MAIWQKSSIIAVWQGLKYVPAQKNYNGVIMDTYIQQASQNCVYFIFARTLYKNWKPSGNDTV